MRDAFACPVCLGSFPSAKALPCRHKLCAGCLATWSETQQTCPECRAAYQGPVEDLPTVYFDTLPCGACEALCPAYVLHHCAQCADVVCGNCVLSGLAHDPAHTVSPFAQLKHVAAVSGALKRKAEQELSVLDDTISTLMTTLDKSLRRAARRSLPAQRLADGLRKAFPDAGEGEAAKHVSFDATQRARRLLEVVGAEPMADPADEEGQVLRTILSLREEDVAKMVKRLLEEKAKENQPPSKAPRTDEAGAWYGLFVYRPNGPRVVMGRPQLIYKIQSPAHLLVYRAALVGGAAGGGWQGQADRYVHCGAKEPWDGNFWDLAPVKLANGKVAKADGSVEASVLVSWPKK